MKIYVFIFALITNALHPMNNQWGQDMCDAITLLQGRGANGLLNSIEIQKIASCIVLAKNKHRELANLHNSPPLLMLPAGVSFDLTYNISSFVAQYKGKYEGETDSLETQYSFSEPTTDVLWVAHEVNKKFNLTAQVKPLFTPKIKFEDGGAGSDVCHITFINLDQQKEYMFTFKGEKIIGSGEKPIIAAQIN